MLFILITEVFCILLNFYPQGKYLTHHIYPSPAFRVEIKEMDNWNISERRWVLRSACV